MDGETGDSHHSLERPRSGVGSVPELFPLPQPNFQYFVEGNGLWFGWNKRRFLIIMGEGSMGHTLHEFSLTEEGWAEAWQTMSSKYPQLAEKVSAHLTRERSRVAERERRRLGDLQAKEDLDRLATYAELQECTLLGGYGWQEPTFVPGSSCVLRFTEEGLVVLPTSSWTTLIRSPYKDALALEFSGPGRVKSGTRIIGGGFGLAGAAGGMIAATVLNSLTSRTNIHTFIRYEATSLEAFFFYSLATPDELRMQLSEVLGHIRSNVQGGGTPAAAPVTRLDQLKQLGELRDSGVLSQAEFETEKQKLLASD